MYSNQITEFAINNSVKVKKKSLLQKVVLEKKYFGAKGMGCTDRVD